MRDEPQPILVHFDGSAGETLRAIMLQASGLFHEASPEQARFIIFGDDDHALVDASALYARWPLKCFCISETDTPTFRLPGLYAANSRSWLTRGRTATVNYLISERANANPAIRAIDPAGFEKTLLYSFMGGSNSWARKRLFRNLESRTDTWIEATDAYNHWSGSREEQEFRNAQRQRYAETMAHSKYALCPRGCGLSSYRLFEAMSIGVAPVIISDRWRPIAGIDWSFALFVKERDIPRLDSIVRAHSDEWVERGAHARSTYRHHLAPEQIARVVWRELLTVEGHIGAREEAIMKVATRANTKRQHAWWAVYGVGKHLILRIADATGAPLPLTLHQSIAEQLGRGKP